MIHVAGIDINLLEPIVILLSVPLVLVGLGQRFSIRHRRLFWAYWGAATLFLSSVLLSSFQAVDPQAALTRGFLKWVEIFGLSLAVLLYASSVPRFRIVCYVLIAASILNLVGQFNWQFLRPYRMGAMAGLGTSEVLLWAFRRISGYDTLAVFSLLLPFIGCSLRVRLTLYVLAWLTLVSLSRGAILALGTVLAYGILASSALRRPLISFSWKALLGFGVGALLLSLMVPEVRWALVLRSTEVGQFSLRRSLLDAALEMFLTRPLSGVGAENFAEYLIARDAYPPGHPMSFPENLAPHNLFVQVAAENGIPGVVALCALVWVVYRIVFRLPSLRDWLPWMEGLRYFALVELFAVGLLGYVSGSQRLQLGLFFGLALASLRQTRSKTLGAKTQGRAGAIRTPGHKIACGGLGE